MQAQNAPGANLGKRVALLVGNDLYRGAYPNPDKNDWSKLDNAGKDAQALGDRLRSLGFSVRILKNLNKGALEAAVSQLVKDGQGAQAVFFYFAGHGAGIDNINYLMPVDAPRVDESFVSVRNNGLKLEAILQPLQTIKSATKIILIDACRGLPAFFRGTALGGHIAMPEPPKGTVVGFSTQAGVPASDAGDSNGPYARALLKGLSGTQLSLSNVLTDAAREMQRMNINQEPVAYATLTTLADFWFAAPQPIIDPRVAALQRENEELRRRAVNAHSTAVLATGSDALTPDLQRRSLPAQASALSQTFVTATSPRVLPVDCDVCPVMVELPAGRYLQGDRDGNRYADELPATTAQITHSFAIGQYEVTQAQWQAVMGSNPSFFKSCGGDCPVEQVSTYEALKYISRLNSRTGNAFGYRLPTESEWVYAARAGTNTQYYTGNTIGTTQANFGGNLGKTTKSGSYPANQFLLHDILGNVWEYVLICEGKSIMADFVMSVVEPIVFPKNCRIGQRGGGWNNYVYYLRAGCRDGCGPPGEKSRSAGLRLARSLQ